MHHRLLGIDPVIFSRVDIVDDASVHYSVWRELGTPGIYLVLEIFF